MFILLNTGAMLNVYWLQDCFQGKHEKNIVIFYMINGTKIIERYDSDGLAQARVEEVKRLMNNASFGANKPIVVSELPTTDIIDGATYYLRNPNGTGEDDYFEYRYVEGKWELQGAAQSDIDRIDNQISWNEY